MRSIKFKREGTEDLSMGQYLEYVRPYLRDMTNNFKKSDKRKLQLTMKPKFMLLTDSNEKRMLHTENDNVENMFSKDADEIIQELFDSLRERYQDGLEQSMKSSGFVFDGLRYKNHKISLRFGGSNIDSPE